MRQSVVVKHEQARRHHQWLDRQCSAEHSVDVKTAAKLDAQGRIKIRSTWQPGPRIRQVTS